MRYDGGIPRRYQDFLGKFNPTLPAPPELRVDVRPDLARRIAARAILEKGSQQVIFGGVGSGKTTELLVATEAISTEETQCVFLDMPLHSKLEFIQPGAILATFGEALSRTLGEGPDFSHAVGAANIFARGKWTLVQEIEDWEPDYDEMVRVGGKLNPPVPELHEDIKETKLWLADLVENAMSKQAGLVLAIDGLDRLHNEKSFWSLVDQDLRILRELKVSVVIVAPLLAYFTPGRNLEERFDKTHPLWSLPKNSPALLEVLQHRDQEILPASSATEIVRYSGGVLRDLISLARDAGEEAYLRGSPQIEGPHVDYAIQQLGLSYRRGLGPVQLKDLQEIYLGGGFDLRNVQHRELLATRRLIEYSPQEFAIHPALLKELSSHDWPQ